MPELVGDDVGLGELARGAKSRAQLVEEPEIEIDLPVGGAVKRTHRGLGEPAARARAVAEENERRALVGSAELREFRFPGLLDLVDHEGDELHALPVFGRLRDGRTRVRDVHGRRTPRAWGRVRVDQREEVLLEDEAQYCEEDDAAAPEAHAAAAEPESSAPSGFSPAILDVGADFFVAVPAHACLLTHGS